MTLVCAMGHVFYLTMLIESCHVTSHEASHVEEFPTICQENLSALSKTLS
jgi:hypothetical protein